MQCDGGGSGHTALSPNVSRQASTDMGLVRIGSGLAREDRLSEVEVRALGQRILYKTFSYDRAGVL